MQQSFNLKNLKTPSFKQTDNTGNKTILGRLGISTANNISLISPLPARFSFRSGIMREVIPIAGYTNGKANGSVVQTIGNKGLTVECEIMLYGDYLIFRNRIIELLQSNKPFALQTFTTQQNQTFQTISKTTNNFILGFASDIRFNDSYDGRTIANGTDTISFTFQEIPQIIKPKGKRSIFSALDQMANFFDKIQTNIGYATLSLQGVNTALIETAKNISNLGSGVAGFIQEVNLSQNAIGSLVKSPIELAKNYQNIARSFKTMFSSGDTPTQKQYYTTLKNVVQYNNDVQINQRQFRQKDGSYLYIYDNIQKNIILGKTTTFLRAVGLLTLCNNYENYTFSNTNEALEAWNNVVLLYDFFANEEKFDGLIASANTSSNFTNSIYNPASFQVVRDYVFQTLEVIRNAIFNTNEIEVKTIFETSNVYEVVYKKYGNYDKLENFMLLNKITSYSTLIKAGTQLQFN